MNKKHTLVAAFVAAVTAVFLFASCATTADKISEIVDDAVEHADQMTEEDWAACDRQIEQLMKKYEGNPELLTEEERQAIDYALGRYYGEQMKQGIEVAKRGMEDFLNRLPGFLDGFLDGLEGLIDIPDTTTDPDTL